IYSARYLLKQFPEFLARGNFLGFAPVSFQSYLQLADLKSSAASLDDVAENYNKSLLYKATQATRQHFLSSVGNYHIVNIFSHARADEANEQPMLFMQDSVIRLSELQYLERPSTRLVVLSACETTVGKNATGEGIYSLARGFAAAGIPSVAATIWKADEEAIYSISKLFHQHLSKGLPMDVALQKAKLGYMQTANREQLLPYYWANMVIIGKVDPLVLEKETSSRFWYVGASSILVAFIILLLWSRKTKRTRPFTPRS
ncbi:MAG TPA: CHAT domain-containing protein, partial [Flavitalea sp.]|nr:CHAT domain-containing protein [Flavitalea sp.]